LYALSDGTWLSGITVMTTLLVVTGAGLTWTTMLSPAGRSDLRPQGWW
tara:strand:+ start:726 stop:869 length:144 start_codon:yes stop_codon:yes gene_type:complete